MDRAALGRKMAKIVILGGVFDPQKGVILGVFLGVFRGGIFHAKTSKLTILMKNIKIPPHNKILSQGV